MDPMLSDCVVDRLCSENSESLYRFQNTNLIRPIPHFVNCEYIFDGGDCNCFEERRREWVDVNYLKSNDNNSNNNSIGSSGGGNVIAQTEFSCKNKNRYPDISAIGKTRVKLSLNKLDESDYINANYVKGIHFSHPDYIATQAPLPSTCGDFWRMIWENKSGAIVMLTKLVEDNKVKACRYWPTEKCPTLTFGAITVSLIESKLTRYNFRVKKLLVLLSGVERQVVHYQFLNWVDYSIPQGYELLRLFEDVDVTLKCCLSNGLTGPLIIHCSAGIGRTGTFIAIHTCLRKLIEENKKFNDIDMPDLVKRLRHQRPGMISNEMQYLFCCQMIQTALSYYTAQSTGIFDTADNDNKNDNFGRETHEKCFVVEQ